MFDANCPSRHCLVHATGRWGALTLASLYDGPLRFGAVRRRVGGISEKMLSQTLHDLEGDGLVERNVLSPMPPSVEYRLSEAGRSVAAKVIELIDSLYESLDAAKAVSGRLDSAQQGVTRSERRRTSTTPRS